MRIQKDRDGFSWKGQVDSPGMYQLWITYYCGDKGSIGKIKLNDKSKLKQLQYMGIETFKKFYLEDGTEISAREVKSNRERIEPYYFREYWGTYELQKERQFNKQLEPLLFSGIVFYNYLTTDDGFVHNAYYENRGKGSNSSIASCGVGLMAYSINHTLGRDKDAEKKY